MKPVEGALAKAPVRRRKPAKPRLPGILDAEVTRLAEEIVAERTADARRVAALELAGKLLKQAVALLSQASPPGTHMRIADAAPPPQVVKPVRPCTWCGREGVRRAPTGGGWLCATHAAREIAEQREEALAGSSLLAALKAAKPEPADLGQ